MGDTIGIGHALRDRRPYFSRQSVSECRDRQCRCCLSGNALSACRSGTSTSRLRSTRRISGTPRSASLGFEQADAGRQRQGRRADRRHDGRGSAYIACRNLFREADRPTALFTANNLVTLGALRAQHDCGIDIPGDMSLLAFDDFEWLRLLRPPVSAIQQPIDQIAVEAWRLMFQQISKRAISRSACSCRRTTDDQAIHRASARDWQKNGGNVSEFAGRGAVITGGGRGIGLACARLIAERGGSVVLLGHDQAMVEGAAAELRADGLSATAIVADISVEAEVADAVNKQRGAARIDRHPGQQCRDPALRHGRVHGFRQIGTMSSASICAAPIWPATTSCRTWSNAAVARSSTSPRSRGWRTRRALRPTQHRKAACWR